MPDKKSAHQGPATGRVLGRAWRAFTNSPALLAAFVIGGSANLILYGVFMLAFLSAFGRHMHTASATMEELNVAASVAVIVLKSMGMILLLCGLLAVRALLLVFHHAGWSNMFAAGARNGRSTLSDYFAGMARWSPRFFAGGFVKLCLHAIPVLVCVAAALGLRVLGHYSGTVLKLVMLLVPVLILLEGLMAGALCMWRPAAVLENLAPPAAFSRSTGFVRRFPGLLSGLFSVWTMYDLAVLIVFGAAAGMVFRAMAMADQPAAHQVFLFVNAGLLAWLFLMVGMIFFFQAFFTAYEESLHIPEPEPLVEFEPEPASEPSGEVAELESILEAPEPEPHVEVEPERAEEVAELESILEAPDPAPEQTVEPEGVVDNEQPPEPPGEEPLT